VFDVLAHLVAHRDRVVPKEEPLAASWGDRFVRNRRSPPASSRSDLVAGCDLAFEARGEHQLRGVPDPSTLYEVAI
jgi:hypothetical protein